MRSKQLLARLVLVVAASIPFSYYYWYFQLHGGGDDRSLRLVIPQSNDPSSAASATFAEQVIEMPKHGPQTFESQAIVLGSVADEEHTTVVSAYFDLSNNSSKSHPNWQFLEWLGKFLRSCEAPLIMYTDARTKQYIRDERVKSAYKTLILVYDDIWALMRELEVRRNQSYRFNYEHVQANYSLPELYAIWNLKAYIAKRATEMNPYNSRFFIYNDAGAWRDWETKNWPDTRFIQNEIQPRIGDRPLLGQLREHKIGADYHCWYLVIEGGFFAGTHKAIVDFYHNYYRIHDDMLSKKETSENYVG